MKQIKQKNGCDSVIASIASLCDVSYAVVWAEKEKLVPDRPLLPHEVDKVYSLLNRFAECKKILRTDQKVTKWINDNLGNKALLIIVQDNRLHCVYYRDTQLFDPSNEECAWAKGLGCKLWQVMKVYK